MKGLVFFKDGHTEEIIDYEEVDNDIHFETASARYTRVHVKGYGYIFAKITPNKHIIPITKITRIDIVE